MAWLEVNAVMQNKYARQLYYLYKKRLQITLLSLKYRRFAKECAFNDFTIIFNGLRSTFYIPMENKNINKDPYRNVLLITEHLCLNIYFPKSNSHMCTVSL